MIGSDPFLHSRRSKSSRSLLNMGSLRLVVAASGSRLVDLISYGNSIPDAYRRAGLQTGRLLRGVKPTDLPIDRSTRFELAINLTTAKALGLTVPDKLLVARRRGDRMRRRAFIFASGCALLPRGARSQHRAQVGFLYPGSAAVGSRIIAVREGLASAGGDRKQRNNHPSPRGRRHRAPAAARGRSRCTVRRRHLRREPSGRNRCADQRAGDRRDSHGPGVRSCRERVGE